MKSEDFEAMREEVQKRWTAKSDELRAAHGDHYSAMAQAMATMVSCFREAMNHNHCTEEADMDVLYESHTKATSRIMSVMTDHMPIIGERPSFEKFRADCIFFDTLALKVMKELTERDIKRPASEPTATVQ